MVREDFLYVVEDSLRLERRAAPGPYRLATFGQSFHWTKEVRAADRSPG